MKRLDLLVPLFACWAGLSGWAAPAWAGNPVRVYQRQSTDQALKEQSRGSLRVGMRVRLKARDRALKTAETGHTATLAYGPGQQGVIVGFIRRRLAGYTFDMAVVRWDPQVWFEWDIPLNRAQQGKIYTGDDLNRMNTENGPAVQLPGFELPAHPETLEPLAAGDKAIVARADAQARARMRALGPPKRTACGAGTTAVPGQYVIFVRPGFEVQALADEYAKKPGIQVRRTWPALASFSIESKDPSLVPLLSDTRLSEVTDNCR